MYANCTFPLLLAFPLLRTHTEQPADLSQFYVRGSRTGTFKVKRDNRERSKKTETKKHAGENDTASKDGSYPPPRARTTAMKGNQQPPGKSETKKLAGKNDTASKDGPYPPRESAAAVKRNHHRPEKMTFVEGRAPDTKGDPRQRPVEGTTVERLAPETKGFHYQSHAEALFVIQPATARPGDHRQPLEKNIITGQPAKERDLHQRPSTRAIVLHRKHQCCVDEAVVSDMIFENGHS